MPNDVHVAFEENIGYDGLALYKKELEAQYDHVLLIDAGDETYAEKYGEPQDLSEKHLAYFSSVPMPELTDYPEGEYPYDPAQAGEGVYVLEGTDVLDAGVSFYMSTSSLAAGVGVLAEEYAPYCNAEGNDLREGGWTLPEAERFSQSFELKDTNILPNPTVMDSGGDFIYRPEAADAMKSELLKGHAIAITYYADQSMPEMSREDLRAILENALYAYGDYYTEEDIEFYLDAATGVTDLSALSREELEYLIKLRAFINDIADLPYDLSAMTVDELILIFQSRVFGAPYDELVADAGRDGYLSFIGEDPVIYAQYTYQMEASNHAACRRTARQIGTKKCTFYKEE